MKIKGIGVGNLKIPVPQPENMRELRALVGTDDDLFYIALRGFDQVRRTHLKSEYNNGVGRIGLIARAKIYWYQHGIKFTGQPRDIANLP